jgi:hypothetical protein
MSPNNETLALRHLARLATETGVSESRLSSEVDVDTTPVDPWPEPIAADAYHGIAGEIVRMIEPHSEADPAALLVQLLAATANAIGRGPHDYFGSAEHHGTLFVLLVGPTGTGRKGTAWAGVRQVLRDADPTWAANRIVSGLSSGEGLMEAVSDPKPERGAPPSGPADRRLLVVESEFASALQAMRREGNTLSAVLRQAWDGGRLVTLTRKERALCVDNAHITVIGHITAVELTKIMSNTEVANGLANRFLFVATRRSKSLPFDSVYDRSRLGRIAERLSAVIEVARHIGRVEYDASARALWEACYDNLSAPRAGAFGRATQRAPAQVRRLALVYALLDGSETVRAEHLRAALAVWDYCERSAAFVLGEQLGDPDADRLHRAFIAAGPTGLSRTEISQDVFKGHSSSARIQAAIKLLVGEGLITEAPLPAVRSAGRREQRWRVSSIVSSTDAAAKNAKYRHSGSSDSTWAVDTPPLSQLSENRDSLLAGERITSHPSQARTADGSAAVEGTANDSLPSLLSRASGDPWFSPAAWKPDDLLQRLRAANVRVELERHPIDGYSVRVSGAKAEEFGAEILRNKPALITYLRSAANEPVGATV